jgi:hypothetical protein
VKLGDENIKLSMLMLNQEQEKAHHYPMDNSQTPVHGHDQKADLIWNDFKDRFGI